MTHLPTVREIADLIGDVYDASLGMMSWESLLTRLRRPFGAEQALLVNCDAVPLPGGKTTTVGMDMEVVTKWEGSKEHVDPWYQAIQRIHQPMAYRGLDLCSKSTLLKSAFYSDSLSALDIEYTLGAITVEHETRNWVFAVYHSKRAGEFSDEQKALYELLLPHFDRALRINRLLSRNERANHTFTDALERSPFGVAVLDAHGAVLWANAKAERIFVACDGVTVRYGSVRFWEYESQGRFNRAVGNVLRMAAGEGVEGGSTFAVSRPSGKRPYELLVCRSNARSGAVFPPSTACLLFIHDPAQPSRLPADVIRNLYDMTAAEARLCVALFETGSLPETLRKLKISRNTAKAQLNNIFNKVGVSSQAQLLRQFALGIVRQST